MQNNDLFDNDSPFGLPPQTGSNAPPEYSVSELSHKLKKVVEDEFSYVRVRGEISRVTVAKSGHMYTSLKDTDAVLDAVCWRTTVGRLAVKPEEGMEVVCTGRLTTYPGRSNYQLVIETMELAGQGALLKMLEERRKKLAAEGLFDESRKKPLPFLPELIGVVTSPTGAVIRDIMHRLDERFPRRVLLWPALVQGSTAAQQVIAAIKGFNALQGDLRPDLLIVARGGGSLEDLMPFNDEALVRAVAASDIPIISAVGHETDTTLIDYAADLRAPTPTAAAEKAVPVRAELLAQTLEAERRMLTAAQRLLQQHRTHVQGLGRGLIDPKRLLELGMQKLDHLSSKLEHGLQNWLQRRGAKLNELSAKLSPQSLLRQINDAQRLVSGMSERLAQSERKIFHDRAVALKNLAAMMESLSFKRVLERGYAVVRDEKGGIVASAKALHPGQAVKIQFKDGEAAATVKK
ncbi:MAG: exodeoxyribonuclease VII large subunit [Alphaproteobacteria bacterium]|nr:exodeoxyribonuclease VII large subunit [Alphaproteobacteria bacterium]MDE2336559.1 exodeoxyribonuclease VII large subunit [Alphaproteobacteria bacterium]